MLLGLFFVTVGFSFDLQLIAGKPKGVGNALAFQLASQEVTTYNYH